MPPTTPDPSVVLHQIGDLVSGPRPDFAAARKILASIDPSQVDLQAQAEQLIRFYEALQSKDGWVTSLFGAVSSKVPGGWGLVAGAVVVLAALFLVSRYGGGATPAPTEALPFPLPIPTFEPAGDGRVITYQHGRLIELAIQPAPKDVSLDGGFSTWPGGRRFRSAWAAPYDGERYVEGGLLMDDDYLYVGAHVGDPWPMRNAHKPGDDADGGWAGGAIQIRLATNVVGDKDATPVGDKYPTDKLIHLTLWQSEGRACLHVAEGASALRTRARLFPAEEGYNGRFEADRDDRGYSMKCRVPWKLLGLDRAPYGRKLGLCWEVCWSDREGKRCVGKLTDFFDAEALRHLEGLGAESERVPGKQSFQRPVVWGRATCPPAR
jgi:hypothetical protein